MVERQRLRAEKELQKNSSRAKNLIVEGGMDPSLLQHDLRFQGDSSMYTMDMQFKRTELAQHPLIRQEIEGLWEMMSVELEGERLKKMRAKHMAQFSTSSSSAATHQDTWRSSMCRLRSLSSNIMQLFLWFLLSDRCLCHAICCCVSCSSTRSAG